MLPPIPPNWRPHLEGEIQKTYFKNLQEFLERERKGFKIYPDEADTFQALELTPFEKVNVLLLGRIPTPVRIRGTDSVFLSGRALRFPGRSKIFIRNW